MPIDPNIALQYKPVQPPDALGTLSNVMQVQNQMGQQQAQQQQIEAQQLALEQAKKAQAEEDLITKTYAETGGVIKDYLAALQGKISPERYAKVVTAFDQMKAQSLALSEEEYKEQKRKNEQLRAIMRDVKDQDSWKFGVKRAFDNGLIPSATASQFFQMPYDPYVADQFKAWGQTQEEILSARKTAAETESAELALKEQKDLMPLNKRMATAKTIQEERKAGGITESDYYRMIDRIVPPDAPDAKDPEINRMVTSAKEAVSTYLEVGDFAKADEEKRNLRESIERLKERRLSLSLRGEVPPDTSARLDRIARAIVSGSVMKINQVISMRGSERPILVDKILQLDPKFDISSLDRKIKMYDYYATGKGGDQLQSYGTFLQHAAAAKQLLQKITQTDAKLANQSINWLRANLTAYPQLANVLVALDPVRKEFETFLLNNRALYESDRVESMKALNPDQPISVSLDVLKQMAHTANARAYEANNRYKQTIGESMPPDQLYSPEAADSLKILGVKPIGKEGKENAASSDTVLMTSPDGKETMPVPKDQVEYYKSKGAKIAPLKKAGASSSW